MGIATGLGVVVSGEAPGEGLVVSHLSRDEAAAKMGHPGFVARLWSGRGVTDGWKRVVIEINKRVVPVVVAGKVENSPMMLTRRWLCRRRVF